MLAGVILVTTAVLQQALFRVFSVVFAIDVSPSFLTTTRGRLKSCITTALF